MEYWAGQALLNFHEFAGRIGTHFQVSLLLPQRRLHCSRDVNAVPDSPPSPPDAQPGGNSPPAATTVRADIFCAKYSQTTSEEVHFHPALGAYITHSPEQTRTPSLDLVVFIHYDSWSVEQVCCVCLLVFVVVLTC